MGNIDPDAVNENFEILEYIRRMLVTWEPVIRAYNDSQKKPIPGVASIQNVPRVMSVEEIPDWWLSEKNAAKDPSVGDKPTISARPKRTRITDANGTDGRGTG